MGILLILLAIPLIAFMPDSWSERMSTIQTYQDDRSAMGRISAWWTNWNLAFHYPFGVGFNAVRPFLFAEYSPYPNMIHSSCNGGAAHIFPDTHMLRSAAATRERITVWVR